MIPHARRAFLGEDPRLGEAVRKLLGMIRDRETFDESILWQRQARYTIESKAEYEEALRQLQDARYIERAAIQKEWSGKGRKPATTWQVLHAEG